MLWFCSTEKFYSRIDSIPWPLAYVLVGCPTTASVNQYREVAGVKLHCVQLLSILFGCHLFFSIRVHQSQILSWEIAKHNSQKKYLMRWLSINSPRSIIMVIQIPLLRSTIEILKWFLSSVARGKKCDTRGVWASEARNISSTTEFRSSHGQNFPESDLYGDMPRFSEFISDLILRTQCLLALSTLTYTIAFSRVILWDYVWYVLKTSVFAGELTLKIDTSYILSSSHSLSLTTVRLSCARATTCIFGFQQLLIIW